MDASKIQKQAGAEGNTSFLGLLQMELRVKVETEEWAAWEPKETSAAHPGHKGLGAAPAAGAVRPGLSQSAAGTLGTLG